MKNVCSLFTLCFVIVLFSTLSCVKEYEIESIETISPPSQELIQAHLYGKVLDENGQAISEADIILHSFEGERMTQTDRNGYFEFPNATCRGNSAYISLKKSGKFDAFRRWSVIKKKWNYTEVKMLDKQVIGTIDAGAGGMVESSQGAKLFLPEGAVVNQNGSPYNGVVKVALQWIDPTADDLHQRIVGDLSGLDIEGRRVALGTYGMMNVELLDNTDRELNIRKGATARLVYPIPDDIHGTPPATVPMWSYDESLGTWIEETIAVKEGDTYVAEVSHFSSWNVDWKGESIKIFGSVTVEGQTGSSVASHKIIVESNVFGKRGGYLTEDGEFLFYNFPANEEFTLTIYNICGNEVYQQAYGPYGQDTDLGVIDISNPDIKNVKVSGRALDCNNDPLEGASVQFKLDSSTYYTAATGADGSFEFITPYCGFTQSATIYIQDIENQKVSPPRSFAIESEDDILLGDILVCDEPEEFVSITIDDTLDVYFTSPQHYIGIVNDAGKSRFVAEGNGYFEFTTSEEINALGTYTAHNYKLFFTSNPGQTRYQFYATNPPDLTIEVTQYSNDPGSFIRGSFSGTVLDTIQSNNLPIEGLFKVKVD